MSDTRPQATHAMVGQVLGSYRVISELSSGGMGTVYRAQHELLDRPAAVKLLRPELTTNEELVQRFFNEAKAATAIRHPGIVEVYDFGYTEHGDAYLVMEFLEGEPLAKRIARLGTLPELEAAIITRGISSALRAAHGKSIFHRDLKPDNVFLVPDHDGGDRVKVLDFGIAKLADPAPSSVRHTQTGVLMGTPLYMAPEQAREAGTIDQRADLYSLGCMLYEMLTGTPPFTAEGAGEIIAMQLFTAPRPVREIRPDVSPELETIVMRLLEKEPRDRYADAAALQKALTNVLPRESGSHILPTPLPGQMSSLRLGILDEVRPSQDRKSSLPIVAGVITVVLAVAGAVTFMLTRAPDAPTPAPPSTVQQLAPAPVPAPPPAPAPATVKAAVPDLVIVDDPAPKRPVKRTKPAKTVDKVETPPESGPVTKPGAYTPDGSPMETTP